MALASHLVNRQVRFKLKQNSEGRLWENVKIVNTGLDLLKSKLSSAAS